MVEGAYQSSQGGVAMVPAGDAPGGGGHGAGDNADAQSVQHPVAVNGLRQKNSRWGADPANANPNTEPSGQNLDGYANEARTMP